MSILQKSSTNLVIGSTAVTSLRKRTATVVGAALLAASFALSGGPAATAALADEPHFVCGGERPGPCPEAPGWFRSRHLTCGGLPGMCPGDRPGPGQSRDSVQLTRCAGQTPGICPGSEPR